MKHGEDDFCEPIDDGVIVPEVEHAPLIPPHKDPDAMDRWWLENVYCGDKMPQLTLRAIVSGMLIGGLMSVSNLYVGLKTGWGLGVTVTSCIIAFAVFKALEAVIPAYRKNPFSILENCTMTSAASAAGYISSAGLVSSIPALYLTTGHPMSPLQMALWLPALVILGVFMAVPLKRQLINIDQLPFPSGTATAATLKSLHSSGAKAILQAKVLALCTLLGALVKMWADLWTPAMLALGRVCHSDLLAVFAEKGALPSEIPFFPGKTAHRWLSSYTLGFEGSVLMIGAGAIMGMRVCVSLLVGSIFFFGFMGSYLESHQIITINPANPYRSIVEWTVWPCVALMVTSSLTSFALRWRTIVRSFSGLASIFGKAAKEKSPIAHLEIPGWWFFTGFIVCGFFCVLFGHWFFDVKWYLGVLAVLLTFILSIVAARATGETDITPIGAMGKITQLTFGMIESSSTTNLMTASITAGAASQSADLLTDLKTGYLIGTNPRRQSIAQFFGVIAGVIVCVPIYSTIVKMPVFDPNAPVATAAATEEKTEGKSKQAPAVEQTNLMTSEFPAPAAAVWKSVAELLSKGIDNLKKGTVLAMIIGGIFGILLALGEEFLPSKYARWLPSATGLSIAGTIPGTNSVAMFIGALIAWIWSKMHQRSADDFVVAGASGLIAGESLMGVAINLWQAAPALIAAIFQAMHR